MNWSTDSQKKHNLSFKYLYKYTYRFFLALTAVYFKHSNSAILREKIKFKRLVYE